MDPGILVPPKGYGGHERLVYMFAKEYAKLGHEVHLLVTKGSIIEGCTVHGYGKEGFPPKKSEALFAIPKAVAVMPKMRFKNLFLSLLWGESCEVGRFNIMFLVRVLIIDKETFAR